MVRGHVREETGKSLRRTLEEEEGELKREEDRGVSSVNSESSSSSSSWQLMEVGTT